MFELSDSRGNILIIIPHSYVKLIKTETGDGGSVPIVM